MSTTYILLKDLPHCKAGSKFTKENDDHNWYNTNGASYIDRIHISRVINNPEWFREELEKKYTEEDMRKCFEMSKSVDFKSGYNFASYQFKDFEDYLKYIKP